MSLLIGYDTGVPKPSLTNNIFSCFLPETKDYANSVNHISIIIYLAY